MAITDGYCTLAEVKALLDIETADIDDDAVLEAAVEGVSRWIDDKTGRRFYSGAATRYYTAVEPHLLFVDDLTAVTTLKTDDAGDGTFENTWSATDYHLEPYNAAAVGKPYTRIRITVEGLYAFPTVHRGVELAATFGYFTSVPSQINQACMLQTIRLWKRKDIPFAVAGNSELGQMTKIPKLDPDVAALLQPFKRPGWRAV